MAARTGPEGDRLSGATAVIAGVGPGMGSAIAVRFADEGARVALVARDQARIEALAATIAERGGTATPHAVDLTDATAVDGMLDAIEADWGVPDVLVNTVGRWAAAPAGRHEPDMIDAMLAANLKSIMTTVPLVAGRMRQAGGGAILNISSAYGGAFPSTGQAVYNATKAGVRAYTESAAADLLGDRVRVNAILPGATGHDFAVDRDLALVRKLGRDTMGAPEDIAAAAVFLCSAEAAWITGASLLVDGGASVRR